MTKTIEVFSYAELDPAAQQKAREWWLEDGLSYDWWDSIYDDFEQIASIIGIELKRKRNDKQPAIYFTLHCQGAGAAFEGRYDYRKGALKAIRKYAPCDTDLHGIVKALQDLQRKHFYGLYCETESRGTYPYVSRDYPYVSLTWAYDQHGQKVSQDVEDALTEIMRDLAHWLHERLDEEYDFLTSEEAVAEVLEANEYHFLADGRLYA